MSDVNAGTPAAERWDERNIWSAGLPVRTAWLLAMVAFFLFVPMLRDRWVYDNWYHADLYDLDWARFLREMGWYPTWVIAALAIWLTKRAANAVAAKRDALYLLAAPAVAGIVCEVLKLVIRRERPETNGGDYGFRAWSDEPFSTGGLATPSSHTMVAFAAATALARLFPGARWVWYPLAAGCAATRVLAHAHFLSDVTLGALLGWSVAWGVWLAMRRRAAISVPA
ncbi:MAG: phosphatase PAP2 family protein [Gemmatimonadetes bacterium]|nr:phosphatase PAP2 family protein [Gemmatimonadota bacterium]